MATLSKIEQEALERARKKSEDYSQTAGQLTDDTVARIQSAVDAQSQAVSQANATAQQQSQSEYDRLIQSNTLQEAVARKNMEDALTRLGYSSPALNQTEDLALQSRLGQANYSSQVQQDQALRLLADLLSNYQAESDASQIETSAGLQNTMQNAALDERMAGFRNAMSETATGYQSQRAAEAEAAQRAFEEERRWAALQPQEQAESFPVDQLGQLVNSGLSVEDALRLMIGAPTEEEENAEANRQAELAQRRDDLGKTYRTGWDKFTPLDTKHEKQLKEYGATEPGRVEALEDIIIEYKDFNKNAPSGSTLLGQITGGYYPKGKSFEERLDTHLSKTKDKWGNRFSEEEIKIIKRELAPEFNALKEQYDFYMQYRR